MRIIHGTDRTAFVWEKYTVKVPRISQRFYTLRDGASLFRGFGRHGLSTWLDYEYDNRAGLEFLLKHGLRENCWEVELAEKYPHVVVPTRSLVHGMMNIQETVLVGTLEYNVVHHTFARRLGPKVTRIGHSLENTNNLGIHNSQVKFIDGWCLNLKELLETHQEQIESALADLATTAGLNTQSPL